MEFLISKTKSKSSKLDGADIHKSCNFDTEDALKLFLSFLETSLSLKKFVLGRMVGKRTISATIVNILTEDDETDKSELLSKQVLVFDYVLQKEYGIYESKRIGQAETNIKTWWAKKQQNNGDAPQWAPLPDPI